MADETHPPEILEPAMRIGALIDEYCHRLTIAVPMDMATFNNVLFGRDELKRQIAAILSSTSDISDVP